MAGEETGHVKRRPDGMAVAIRSAFGDDMAWLIAPAHGGSKYAADAAVDDWIDWPE